MPDTRPEPATHYLCSTCGASFSLLPSDPHRCPECLRTSGLVERQESDAETPSGRRLVIIAGALLLLLGAAAAAVYLLTRPAEPATASEEEDAKPAEGPAKPVSAGPELGQRPDTATEAVRAAAASLPEKAEGIVSAITTARTSGKLPPRGEDDELTDAPRSAEVLVPALTGKQAPAAGSLEYAALAAALFEARGLGPVTWGIDEAAPRSATDLRHRVYLLRVGDGPWLAPDGGVTPSGQVTPLDEGGLLANFLAWRALGDLAADDVDKASRAISKATELAPDDAAIAFNAGRVQISGGLVEIGLATMETAAAKKSDGFTWFSLGLAANAAEQAFKAHQYFVRATEVDPAYAAPHVMLAQLALDRYQLTPKTEQEALVKEASDHIAAAEAIDPKTAGIRTIKAQLAALEGRNDDAEKLLRDEVDLHPDEESSWLALTQFLVESGRSREALELLLKADEGGHATAGILSLAGALQVQARDLPAAAASLRRALEIAPDDTDLRPQIAQIEHARGNTEAARALLGEQLDKNPDDVNSRLLLSQLEFDEENYDQAKAELDRAMAKVDAPSGEMQLLAYVIALKRGKGIEETRPPAIAAAGGRTELAQVLLEQGLWAEGEGLLRATVAEEPSNFQAPLMLYAISLMNGNDEEAERLRADTLGRAPEDKRAELESQFDQAKEQAHEARANAGGGTPDAPAPGSDGGDPGAGSTGAAPPPKPGTPAPSAEP